LIIATCTNTLFDFVKLHITEVYARLWRTYSRAGRGKLAKPLPPVLTALMPNKSHLRNLRELALEALRTRQPIDKCIATAALLPPLVGISLNEIVLDEPCDLPGRPAQPPLVPPGSVKQRSVQSIEGRASLIHALAHIEFNAVNLALDIVWRFAGLPNTFYADWLSVAKDEARHFLMLREHLLSLGFDYGDFPAHNGLWEMAEKTKADLIARLALVPRTLEARGLDASPQIRHKLASAGDAKGASILDIILKDEIVHVAVGNHWYRYVCATRGVDPVKQYALLSARYRAPALRGPFNLEARRAAGFTEEELIALTATISVQKT
jgi:uncharacterized ferritin-like protein (DUF455 family)